MMAEEAQVIFTKLSPYLHEELTDLLGVVVLKTWHVLRTLLVKPQKCEHNARSIIRMFWLHRQPFLRRYILDFLLHAGLSSLPQKQMLLLLLPTHAVGVFLAVLVELGLDPVVEGKDGMIPDLGTLLRPPLTNYLLVVSHDHVHLGRYLVPVLGLFEHPAGSKSDIHFVVDKGSDLLRRPLFVQVAIPDETDVGGG